MSKLYYVEATVGSVMWGPDDLSDKSRPDVHKFYNLAARAIGEEAYNYLPEVVKEITPHNIEEIEEKNIPILNDFYPYAQKEFGIPDYKDLSVGNIVDILFTETTPEECFASLCEGKVVEIEGKKFKLVSVEE